MKMRKTIKNLKVISVCLLVCISIIGLRTNALHSQSVAVADEVNTPTTQPSGDAGTDAVAAFYRVLLTDKPATLKEEEAIFLDRSTLRGRLEFAGKGGKTDPVVLQFYKDRREMFIPKNFKSVGAIQVSSTFNFLTSLKVVKNPPRDGEGEVQVLFVDDVNVRGEANWARTVTFRVRDGKINADGTFFDGSRGSLLYYMLPK